MNPQNMTKNYRIRSFLIITLSMLIVVLLSAGCVTPKAINYAKRKASSSNVVEFTLAKVHSATVHENKDVSILVELSHPNHDRSGLYTMTIPLPSLVEKADAITSFGFRINNVPSVSRLPHYLYPIRKAKKISEDIDQMKDFPSSSISIEELNLQNDEAGRLLDIIEGLNGDCSGEEKVYMVNFLPDATSKVVGEDPDKVIEDNSYVEKNILLVYWPPLTSDPVPKTIAIAGAYEDESTRLYYFLVPPAVVADSLLIALCVVGEAFANGSFDFGSH